MLSRLFSFLGSVVFYVIAFVIGVVVTYLWFKSNFISPASPGSTTKISIEVVEGSNMKEISKSLEQNGILKHWWSLYGRYRILSSLSDKSAFTIIPGEYELSPGNSIDQILDTFRQQKVVYHEVVIPEGMRVSEVARVLTSTGLVTSEDLRTALSDRNLMANLNIPSSSFEGYLFPLTYKFTKPIDARKMLTQMVNDGRREINAQIKTFAETAIDLGFSQHQILTLASVIEKETGDAKERPTISSVFHNRLRIGMPLQSDPTVIYGLASFNGNLTKQDLQSPSPYNTYLNVGLPPTPIANPGIESIRAALFPAETDFLYFVAKGDGSHQFSATYKEHLEAVKKYQLKQGD
jgi:UPF0755 protein